MNFDYTPLQFSTQGFNGPGMNPIAMPVNGLYNPLDMYGSSMANWGGIAPAMPAPVASMTPSPALPAGNGGWFSGLLQKGRDNGFFSTTDKNDLTTQGWGGMAFQAGTSLLNAYTGMKNLGLMEDQLKFEKQKFNKNYEAQKTSINSQLEDRQRARVASNAGAYESVGDYMDKNRIK